MLFILAVVVACIAWTVTQEFIFEGFRLVCEKRKKEADSYVKSPASFPKYIRIAKAVESKFWYLPTCYYCFSHYIAVFVLFVSHYKLFYSDWRGYFFAFFSLIAIANVYLTIFALLRQLLKAQKARATIIDKRASRLQ